MLRTALRAWLVHVVRPPGCNVFQVPVLMRQFPRSLPCRTAGSPILLDCKQSGATHVNGHTQSHLRCRVPGSIWLGRNSRILSYLPQLDKGREPWVPPEPEGCQRYTPQAGADGVGMPTLDCQGAHSGYADGETLQEPVFCDDIVCRLYPIIAIRGDSTGRGPADNLTNASVSCRLHHCRTTHVRCTHEPCGHQSDRSASAGGHGCLRELR